MTKKVLRAQLLGARNKLSCEYVDSSSRALLQQFQHGISISQGARVHLFRSVSKFNEVKTEFFFDWFSDRRPDITIALPRVVSGQKELDHHLFRDGDPLLRSRWGIEEPLEAAPKIGPEEIDLVIVPLLAFDKNGYRIGYGGGFYDRFLARVGPQCRTVGVSFEEGYREQPLPIDEFDVPLQAVVTPSQVFRFT